MRAAGNWLKQFSWLAWQTAQALVRTYGTLCRHMLESGVGNWSTFGADLTAQACRWEVVVPDHERVGRFTREDILWRRTQAGLHLQQIDTAAIATPAYTQLTRPRPDNWQAETAASVTLLPTNDARQ